MSYLLYWLKCIKAFFELIDSMTFGTLKIVSEYEKLESVDLDSFLLKLSPKQLRQLDRYLINDEEMKIITSKLNALDRLLEGELSQSLRSFYERERNRLTLERVTAFKKLIESFGISAVNS